MTTVFSLTSLADLETFRMYRKLGRVARVPACRRLRQENHQVEPRWAVQ